MRSPGFLRRNGLFLVLFSIFFIGLLLAAWLLHALTGSREFSGEELAHGGQAVSMWRSITTSPFWFESLQNWQSELLAVAALMLATVWLRQQGSAQSKPVHEPHAVN